MAHRLSAQDKAQLLFVDGVFYCIARYSTTGLARVHIRRPFVHARPIACMRARRYRVCSLPGLGLAGLLQNVYYKNRASPAVSRSSVPSRSNPWSLNYHAYTPHSTAIPLQLGGHDKSSYAATAKAPWVWVSVLRRQQSDARAWGSTGA